MMNVVFFLDAFFNLSDLRMSSADGLDPLCIIVVKSGAEGGKLIFKARVKYSDSLGILLVCVKF